MDFSRAAENTSKQNFQASLKGFQHIFPINENSKGFHTFFLLMKMVAVEMARTPELKKTRLH